MRPIGGCLSTAAGSTCRPAASRRFVAATAGAAAAAAATAPSRCLGSTWRAPAAAILHHRHYSSYPSSPPPSSQSAPRHSIARLLEWAPESDVPDVVVNGYIRSVRSMKTASFVSLADGSSLNALQAVVPADQASGLSVGAAVRFVGSWVKSQGSGQSHELRVDRTAVVGPSDAKTFPIQKKYHTPEFLRTLPHLRSRTALNSALLRLRSEVTREVSQFFASRDFVQTHPPIITSSDCEGAGEAFTLRPAADIAISDCDGTGETSASAPPFFGSPKYLTVSSQLHLEALAQSVNNVWTLSPTFRAEKSDTARHLSEFYMLEAEMAFVDGMDPVMDLAEDLLRYVARELHGTRLFHDVCQGRSVKDSGHGGDMSSEEIGKRWGGLMSAAWPRITYTDAMALLEKEASREPKKFGFAPEWGHGLQAEHERYIADVVGEGTRPVFVTHYPRGIKAFYMLTSSSSPGHLSAGVSPSGSADAGTAERVTVDCFDLLVPDLCEIAGGSMREHRLQPLLDAMQSRGMVIPAADAGARQSSHGASSGDGWSNPGVTATPSPTVGGGLDWYIDLRRWGCPPHGGFGIGFDRLLCYMSGVQTIRDMATFPRWHGRCDC
ncbi:hypothetical protein RB597_000965 [Gaeumannomyces tritici]